MLPQRIVKYRDGLILPMANSDHVALIRHGAERVREWREANPGAVLDLSGSSFREDFPDPLIFRNMDLSYANMFAIQARSADFHGANLAHCNLAAANLRFAHFFEANLDQSDLTIAQLEDAQLTHASLRNANFTKATLSRANLSFSDVAGANFTEAVLDNAEMRAVKGLDSVSGLAHVTVDAPVRYIETSERGRLSKYLDWERLRTVGRLPLFGASYTTLILTPLILSILAWYNSVVDVLRVWAQIVLSDPGDQDRVIVLAASVMEHLHRRPVPSQTWLVLVSALLLAIASTLYTFFCPSRIKEFSRDQWVDQLGRSLLHYWPLAWSHRNLRVLCAACYALGGVAGLWVILVKVVRAAIFIWDHSTFSWV